MTLQNSTPRTPLRDLASTIGWHSILLGVALRLLLMPFALHIEPKFVGDIVSMNSRSYVLASGHTAAPLLYPPLAYYTIALFQSLLHPLVSPIPLQISGSQALVDWVTHFTVFRQLFGLKIWYLLFDLGAGFLLWSTWRSEPKRARTLLSWWLLNPIIIYTAYFHGQFDVVPLFFVALGLYFGRRAHPRWVTFWIGLGACYKNFPFFFLLPAVIVLAKTWRERFNLLLIGTLPYLGLMLPVLDQYRASLGRYPNWFFIAGYDLGLGNQVYFFFVFYAALLWHLYRRKAHTFEDLWRACFAILLVYYQLSYFDLHYWAWVIPFAAIYWVERPQEARPFYLVIGLCLLVLLAPTPLARFLAPISPRFFLRLPSLLELLNPYLPVMFIVNVVRSLLAGTCLFLAYRLLRDMPASRQGAPKISPDSTTAY
jgi:hypothetical protein